MISKSKLMAACAAALLLGLSAPAAKAADDATKPVAAKKKDTSKDAKTPAPAAPPCGKKADEGFWQRLNEAYASQSATPIFTPPKPGDPAPSRRGYPSPFDGPPYPTAEWQLGGGPNIIGDPGALRDSPYPLMQALYDGPNGCWWYDSRIQIYGWETVGGNISTSRNTSRGPNANFPVVYDERPNRLEQDQFVIYIERMADEFQTDHIDWGFRIAMVYGLDYRFMISRGFLDQQIIKHDRYAGLDLPMVYFNLYIPNIAQGMNITIGRIISEPDIEQQLAPNNLMASHSILYGFDDYTLWGLWTTTKLNDNWTLQAGIACGVDLAPWQSDVGRQPTGSIMLQYIAPGQHDSWYAGMNSFNNGNFGYNNLQECIASYTHKFNDKVWTTFEAQYMYMKNATTAPTAAVPYQNAFFPVHGGFIPEGGILNYTCFRLADNTFLTFRNEWYDDSAGNRTGVATSYYETSMGITWWPNKLLCIRPEIRYDHSCQLPAFDNGLKKDQITIACDATIHF